MSIGSGNKGVNESHINGRKAESYLMACGTVEIRVETETIGLSQGQVILVEPGEARTFLSCSPDYYCYVIQVPGL